MVYMNPQRKKSFLFIIIVVKKELLEKNQTFSFYYDKT